MKYIKSKINLKRILRFALYHSLSLLVLLLIMFFYKCPFNYYLHFPCPGCGITRAYKRAFMLDFKGAISYHPLFFIVLPIILYIPHRRLFKNKLSTFNEILILSLIYILFLLVFFIRIYNQSIFALIV